MKLFCLPYAGGLANIYCRFKKYLNPNIELVCVELSGRGYRKSEPFYQDVDEAVKDILNNIGQSIKDEQYAFFGHSMGGLLIYELTCKINELGLNYPSHLFISAARAPHSSGTCNNYLYQMPNEELLREIKHIGGTNEQFFREPKLIDYFLPIIRADYKLVEEYKFKRFGEKIKCGMTGLYANDDVEVKKEEVKGWVEYATKDIQFFEFNGGHFYFVANIKIICDIINNVFLNI